MKLDEDSPEWEQIRAHADRIEDKGARLLNSSLCARCKNGFIFRGAKLDTQTFCHEINRYVPSDIEECTGFERRGQQTLYTLQQLAEIIDARQGINPKAYK